MSGLLQSVAEALPIAAAGFAGDPAQTMQVIEWSEKQQKERNLRAFGKEIFGSGDPKALTPERIYEAAQKYKVSPEEATHLTMNYLAFKKQMKGDPRLVSVPMPDGRFRSSEVPESELPQFMQANPGAVQGQVYGQKNDPLEPYQVQQAQLQNERLRMQNQYMPKEMDTNLAGAQLQNERLRMQNQFMPREQEAGLTGMNLSNQGKMMELENLKAGPEKDQKTVAFLNEIFSIQDPTKRTIDVLYKTGAKYGLAPKEVQTAMLSATKAQEQLTGKPDEYKIQQQMDDTRSYYGMKQKALLDPMTGMVIKGKETEYNQIMQQMQDDLRKIYRGETPSYLSDQAVLSDYDKQVLNEIRNALVN